MGINRSYGRASPTLPPASSSGVYSSWLRIHEPVDPAGRPRALLPSSWRPKGVMSSSAQMLLRSSAAREVV